mmetsp:Transcript_118744/g.335923  ORF Transcript_118744/g.335923 Transcript_118744/m.335923 type:complete len:279 (-) Transcript_118744:1127-1963(-)
MRKSTFSGAPSSTQALRSRRSGRKKTARTSRLGQKTSGTSSASLACTRSKRVWVLRPSCRATLENSTISCGPRSTPLARTRARTMTAIGHQRKRVSGASAGMPPSTIVESRTNSVTCPSVLSPMAVVPRRHWPDSCCLWRRALMATRTTQGNASACTNHGRLCWFMASSARRAARGRRLTGGAFGSMLPRNRLRIRRSRRSNCATARSTRNAGCRCLRCPPRGAATLRRRCSAALTWKSVGAKRSTRKSSRATLPCRARKTTASTSSGACVHGGWRCL